MEEAEHLHYISNEIQLLERHIGGELMGFNVHAESPHSSKGGIRTWGLSLNLHESTQRYLNVYFGVVGPLGNPLLFIIQRVESLDVLNQRKPTYHDSYFFSRSEAIQKAYKLALSLGQEVANSEECSLEDRTSFKKFKKV